MITLKSTNYDLPSKHRRTSTIMSLVPNIGGGLPVTPGTGASFNEPGSQTTPMGQSRPVSQARIQSDSQIKTDSQRMASELQEPQNNPTVKAKRTKNQNRSRKPAMPMTTFPRGRRPENEKPGIKFTTADQMPSGEMPYRDGPPVTTSSFPVGYIGELTDLRQANLGWVNSSQLMNNIRCHIQVLNPAFFNQMPSFIRINPADISMDTNQDRIFKTLFNQMRDTYQENFNINKSFDENFTYQNLFIYFHDVFALYGEYVCYLQRSAYYRDKAAGMENLLFDFLSMTFNNDTFTPIRNKMARALRFSYLPKSVIDRTYEIYQTYRLGERDTSGTTVFVTKNMATLINSLGNTQSQAGYNAALNIYSTEIDKLIKNVTQGRENGTNADRGIMRLTRTSNIAGNYSSSALQEFPLFLVGQGGLTEVQINSIKSFLGRISRFTNLTLLNNQARGNSQSHYDVDFCDLFNNQLTVANDITIFPKVVSVGNNGLFSPPRRESVIYASEKREEDILFKDVSLQLERFSGGGDLLFRTDHVPATWSRFYLVERDRVGGDLPDDSDIRCVANANFTKFNLDSHAFVQDNFVTKVFLNENTTEYRSVNNTDGTSAAQYYLTFGHLLDAQYQAGIDLLK